MLKDLSWNEEDQMAFYQELKKLPESEQGNAILQRVDELLDRAQPKHDSLLKGIESMLNLWVLRYSNPEKEKEANSYFIALYEKMGLAEKADNYRKR